MFFFSPTYLFGTNLPTDAEPYFITKAADFPRYDERFFYGDDKMEQVFEAASGGLKFSVLPPRIGSLLHWDHPEGKFKDDSHEIARTRLPGDILLQVVARSHCLNGLRGVPEMGVAKSTLQQSTPRSFVCTTDTICRGSTYASYFDTQSTANTKNKLRNYGLRWALGLAHK